MLDQSYYKKTDEIIEHYGRKASITDSNYAGHSGRIPVIFQGELLTYVACQDRSHRGQGVQRCDFLREFFF